MRLWSHNWKLLPDWIYHWILPLRKWATDELMIKITESYRFSHKPKKKDTRSSFSCLGVWGQVKLKHFLFFVIQMGRNGSPIRVLKGSRSEGTVPSQDGWGSQILAEQQTKEKRLKCAAKSDSSTFMVQIKESAACQLDYQMAPCCIREDDMLHFLWCLWKHLFGLLRGAARSLSRVANRPYIYY